MKKSVIKIGLIGSGFMGKSHALAYKSAPTVFPLSVSVKCELLADRNPGLAAEKAAEFGFSRSTGDWRTLIADPEIDVVDICSPNFLHKEMALAAIAAGKHIYSEKPLALNAADALVMTLAAEKAQVKTLVGFNYAKNPTARLAREIISSGEIGEVVHFRGTHNEDYLADPETPHSWRLTRQLAGPGALADMGSHIINMAQYLVGDITEVSADLQTVIGSRPISGAEDGRMGTVENDDQAHCMVRFANGAIGTLETSRIAWGRKLGLSYEVTGTLGSLFFNQERMSEIKLFSSADPGGRAGFRTILLGPEHPDYRFFCPASGHGLGYGDQKVVEVRDLIEGIATDKPLWPDFRAAYAVNQVMDAMENSHVTGTWVAIN